MSKKTQSINLDAETMAIRQEMKNRGINFSHFVRSAMKKLAKNDYVYYSDGKRGIEE